MVNVLNTKVVDVPIDTVSPHPDNPRVGNVDAIADSILTNGFYGALIVQKSTNHIIAGNHRWKAAVQLGMKTVPSIMVDVDDEAAVRILLADNRTSDLGTYDDSALATLLSSLPTLDGTGYTPDDLSALLPDITDRPPKEDEPLRPPMETSWFLVRAPLDRHTQVAEVLKQVEDVVTIFTSHN
jgi:hypothetical protein